jgi:hypothetical protein
MDPIPASCRFFLGVIRALVQAVTADAHIIGKPLPAGPPLMASRLRAGLRVLENCLRRLLIAMALEFEREGLVSNLGPHKRPHGRKALSRPRKIKLLAPRFNPFSKRAQVTVDDLRALGPRKPKPRRDRNALVDMRAMNARLEQLAAIAADPVKRAKRLAYHLARNRPGPISGLDARLKPPGWLRPYWGAEASITYSALAFQIHTHSMARPPPLPKRRVYGPSVTVIC